MSVRRNTLYNVIGAMLPIGVSLLTVPAYLSRIGEGRFGILSIVWLLLGYFGLFDLGLGIATAQQIAARQKDGRATQARIFWTALLTNLGLGIVGGAIAWPLAEYYFAHVLKVDAALRSEILGTVPWLVIAVPLATVTGVATGALQGLHRFATLNIISVTGTMLFQLLPLAVAVFWSPTLTAVLPVAILARALSLVMLFVECRRSLLRGERIQYHSAEVRLLLRFGLWVTVSAFFAPFLSVIDRFLIGGLISAAAVSAYVVPFNLGERLGILGNSAGAALFPRFSSISREESEVLAYRSERLLLAVILAVAVAAIFLIRPFISIWIGVDFSRRSSAAGELLMAGMLFDSLSRVPLTALRGQFRPEIGAKVDLAQLVPYWVVLYALVLRYGIEGAAAAYVFRSALNYVLLAQQARTLAKTRWMIGASSLLLLCSIVGARQLEPLSSSWAFAFLATLALSLVLGWQFLPESDRDELKHRLRGSFARAAGP